MKQLFFVAALSISMCSCSKEVDTLSTASEPTEITVTATLRVAPSRMVQFNPQVFWLDIKTTHPIGQVTTIHTSFLNPWFTSPMPWVRSSVAMPVFAKDSSVETRQYYNQNQLTGYNHNLRIDSITGQNKFILRF